MTEDPWEWEYRQRRMAWYRAKYLSWKVSRKMTPPPFHDHWLHMPMRWVDTGEPVTGVTV